IVSHSFWAAFWVPTLIFVVSSPQATFGYCDIHHQRFRKKSNSSSIRAPVRCRDMTDASAPQRLAPTTDGGPVGPVMVIGGAEDKLGERVILSRFAQLAGGDRARIVVISTASSLGAAATELYRHIFARVGAVNV